MACLGMPPLPGVSDLEGSRGDQNVHRFDVKMTQELSTRETVRMQYGAFIELIGSLREDLGDEEVIRLLERYSAAHGRLVGERQAQRSPDRTFQTFTATFRPPAYANSLVHEVVEDTDTAFGLRVTECVWAAVFNEAGFDGAIGHAAICNMDYTWPAAFNSRFRMERSKTLMEGADQCNHRYIQDVE